jgi:hypothetical protein
MAKRKRWLPTNRKELYDLLLQATAYIDANLDRFGMQETTVIGKWDQDFYDGPCRKYKDAFLKWENASTRTKADTDDMIDAEKLFLPAFRKLYKIMTANPVATDGDLERMGFPKRPTGERTPAPVASEPPGFELIPLPGHQIRIDYFPLGKRHQSAKPDGQRGIEIKWGFSDVVVQDPELLDHSNFDTATPAVLAFSGSDLGRKLYVAIRWENTRGDKGPWSVPVEAAVP